MPRSASRRDNSEPAVSFSVNNRNDGLLCGTDKDETLFAVVLAVIQSFDTKGIPGEDLYGRFAKCGITSALNKFSERSASASDMVPRKRYVSR